MNASDAPRPEGRGFPESKISISCHINRVLLASAPLNAQMCFCLSSPGAEKLKPSDAQQGMVVDFND
jgi:hypothetical protein